MLALAARDLGPDPELAELAPVLVVVVGAVGGDPLGPSAWPTDPAAPRGHPLDERDTLADVVAVAAGER